MTSLCSNPVDIVRTRIMNESLSPNKTEMIYKNPFSTFFKILKHEGFFGLYKGFVPSYIRLGGCTAVSFVIVEQIRLLIGIPTI